jgi:hypothetical protein
LEEHNQGKKQLGKEKEAKQKLVSIMKSWG